jgi:hypothetical protein
MEDRPLFAGQVERLEFDLEQIKAIASPARSEVFWGYSSREPSSVQEVAQGMNRSTGTVHYHTNELVRVGLLIQAEPELSDSMSIRAGGALRFGSHDPTSIAGQPTRAFMRSCAQLVASVQCSTESYPTRTGSESWPCLHSSAFGCRRLTGSG